ncbi:type I-A CRISPR-associated protein Cas5a [Fervidicoccus fontis]|uniref:type I-A CRISPR-associated protein Cas5a n=1 Tax=Fervidicoccus fontis TaxID=683846 RepID=UPI000AB8BA72|nr:type I-A CRISPR-associated protein Cas5a [Fervidicoccus fontis]
MTQNKPFFLKVNFLPVSSAVNFGIITATKSRTSFRLPPPTTLIGALSYPLAKLKNFPESSEDYMPKLLSSSLRGVYFRSGLSLLPYSTVTKMWFYKKNERELKSDAFAYQRLYVSGESDLSVIYLFDEDAASRNLGHRWKEEVIAASFSMVRLGDKESLISPTKVSYGVAEEICNKEFVTDYTVPLTQIGLKVESFDGGVVEIVEHYDWRKMSGPTSMGMPTIKVAFAYDGSVFTQKKLRVYSDRDICAYAIEENEIKLIEW